MIVIVTVLSNCELVEHILFLARALGPTQFGEMFRRWIGGIVGVES